MSALLYLGLCILVGYYASRRGRSAVAWFIIALLISPIISAIILAIMRDLTVDQAIRRNSMEKDRIKERIAVSETAMNARMDHMEHRMDRLDGGTAILNPGEEKTLLHSANGWIYCRQCGAKTDISASYCPNCGTKLPKIDMVECPYCHNDVRSDAVNCPYCHQLLS